MKIKSLIVASLAAVVCAAPAFAEGTTVSYNVAATSDYLFRGISQSGSKAAISGGIDLSAGALYAGTWASTVGFAKGTELDLYAGYKPTLGPVTFDIGVLAYDYPGENTCCTAVEYKAGVSGNLGPVAVSLTDYYHYTGVYNYVELGAGAALGKAKVGPFALSASATAGKYVFGGGNSINKDYTNYKVAFTGTAENGIAVELGYVGNSYKASDDLWAVPFQYNAGQVKDSIKDKAYVTLKKTF